MAARRRRRQPVDANGDPVASELERTFDTLWRQLGGPELFAEYHFAPPRKWAFDRCHPYARVYIEIDGGTWGKYDKDGVLRPGRHTTGKGFRDDCIKLNAAAALGWIGFRLTADMLRDDPVQHLEPIIAKIADIMDDGE